MSTIIFRKLCFGYSGIDLFTNLDLVLDTHWRTALVGRNGRGKTTLLRLIAGELHPEKGSLTRDCNPRLFHRTQNSPSDATSESLFNVVLDGIAPYRAWEARMDSLLQQNSDAALKAYAEIQEDYVHHGGYEIRAQLEKELTRVGLPSSLWQRRFASLSGGERTRAKTASLFAANNSFALIDEPTNHLDLKGRQQLAEYLCSQSGFLLASHDRQLLGHTTNHVLALNRSNVSLEKGSYVQWRERFLQKQLSERAINEQLKAQIGDLERSARQRRRGAEKKEAEKAPHTDKGFIGHRAARQMRRARALERRVESNIAERKTLLTNSEKRRALRLRPAVRRKILIQLSGLTLQQSNRTLLENFDLQLESEERVAILGSNGCGKSTLLNELSRITPPSVRFTRGYQTPLWAVGSLRQCLAERKYDEARFCQVLGVLGVPGAVLDQPMETLSQGQLKKIDLTRSFLDPVDFLIWDEPLNYLDIEAREQVETVILKDRPTLIFVEHDEAFISQVATRTVNLEDWVPK